MNIEILFFFPLLVQMVLTRLTRRPPMSLLPGLCTLLYTVPELNWVDLCNEDIVEVVR